MIPRYSKPEMAQIWSDENKYKIWLEVETLVLEEMAQEGTVPKEAAVALREKGKFDVARVLEIEQKVKHDVIAFLTNVAEHVGPLSRYVHRGMTSNDLLDTTYAVQLKQSAKLITEVLDQVIESTLKRAKEFKDTPCIGRSHGIHAEPTTFGIKLLSWYSELKRQKVRLEAAVQSVLVGKVAGAVGTYASITPTVEKKVMTSLGLRPETVPSQIVMRDRHAEFFSVLAQIGSSIERFAVEVRHLQRTEVQEAEEKFTKGQKGSSAMPHKRNPILSENITGMARLLRGYSISALENVALWHERDISHSSVERVISPDACILTHFMLVRFRSIIDGLVAYPEKMMENINSTGNLVYSGTLLLALVDAGVTREDSYEIVQKHAMESMGSDVGFKERVLSDEKILSLISKDEVESVFSLDRHTKHVDLIFDRAISE